MFLSSLFRPTLKLSDFVKNSTISSRFSIRVLSCIGEFTTCLNLLAPPEVTVLSNTPKRLPDFLLSRIVLSISRFRLVFESMYIYELFLTNDGIFRCLISLF